MRRVTQGLRNNFQLKDRSWRRISIYGPLVPLPSPYRLNP